MAQAVVSFVVERLGDIIVQECKFFSGVGDQVKLAQTELRMMQSFLKDADARQRDEEVIRVLVSEIRDAAYDLENVVETFILKVASKRKGGVKNFTKRLGSILLEAVNLHQIGLEIGNITTKISNLRMSLQTYNIREIAEGTTSLHERKQQLRRTYSHVIERNVVGLEDSVKELVMHLVKNENCHRVVSIWGMGGLGKSTLAKQVYHNKQVRRHFDSFAWVCISQQFKERNVWQEILVRLISPTTEERKVIVEMSDDEIAKKLYLLQQDRRCLVVLDDIWTIEALDSLKAAFPYEETKSMILLTTREKKVALHSDTNGFLHHPRPLNENESWELFETIAILGRDDRGSEIYGKLKELGKKMLQRCAGLPLAINVLAGLLAKKNTVDEWDAVHKNVYANIRRGKGDEDEYLGASLLLALSYDSLPYHLKPCFLYLGNFPEDYEILAKELTRLWIAEGFISLAKGKQGIGETVEDVAYNCLVELVERCLVQVGERGSVREIKTYRIHDLMRDLCLLKAEEENFLQFVNASDIDKVTGKVRRLSICLDGSFLGDTPITLRDEIRNDHVRSLLYFGPDIWRLRHNVILPEFRRFNLLRVLKLEGFFRFGKFPTEIGDMILLRFLSLRNSSELKLPSSIGNLIHLQTLDCRFHVGGNRIPNVIWKMEELRHLYLPRLDTRNRMLRLSTLCNLQTFVGASTGTWNLSDLTELTNLRKLVVTMEAPCKNWVEMLRSASGILQGIRTLSVTNKVGNSGKEVTQHLVLSCRQVYKLELGGKFSELLKHLLDYPNLTKLSLNECKLKGNRLAILEKLPHLRILQLLYAFEESIEALVFSQGGFPQLEYLATILLRQEEWKVEEGAMPHLYRLGISKCSELKRLPDGLRHITTLKELSIDQMPRRFCTRLEEGGDDFYKVQHVPSIVITNITSAEEE